MIVRPMNIELLSCRNRWQNVLCVPKAVNGSKVRVQNGDGIDVLLELKSMELLCDGAKKPSNGCELKYREIDFVRSK